ncbi:MAG TPA: hypothetical protein VEI03_22970 [Stellaceae bacterium]|nr:hypothetical protein [Stellaceae bacterium]
MAQANPLTSGDARPDRTSASSACDAFDRPDAPPFGWRRVLTQACHDLYGTKDVQDAITASYVWMADQIGHLTLGLVPTLLLCWILYLALSAVGIAAHWWEFAIVAGAIFAYWIKKELDDLKETRGRAGNVFPFDSGDIVWNVKTALLYFAIGGLFGLAAFMSWRWLLLCVVLALWPIAIVAFWWLRRKLAFQQAGLPYLYRLANFTSALEPALVEVVCRIANLRNRKIRLLEVLLGRDVARSADAEVRHMLITGPLGAGKTSLCVGIGTEFSFALGKARYLTVSKLVQLVLDGRGDGNDREYDDGRVLWRWRDCELLAIDDVDAGVSVQARDAADPSAHLIEPDTLVRALSAGGSRPPLDWLGRRRSVWVLGDAAGAKSWRRAIAELIGVREDEIAVVELAGKLGAAEPSLRARGRLVA